MLVYPSAKRIDCSGLFAALVSSALLFHPSVHPARADEICMVGAAAQDKISDAALLLDPEIHQFRWVSDDGANGHIDTGEMPYREVAPNSGNPQRVLFTFVANGAPASCAATTGAQAHANVWLGAPGHQMLFAVDEFTLDIRADTNRDGAIDDKDEAGKRVFTTGAGGKGAIVWVNCDDNKGSSGDPDNRVPDNWPGGNVNTTFDPATQTWTQVFKPPDNKVNGGGDLNDITPFVVYKTGVDALPPSLKITLSLDLPVGVTEPSYFTGIAPAQRIRVFLPTRVDGSDIVCQAGDKGILGPVAANPDRSIRYENSVDFVQNPAVGATQLSYDRFKGKGRVVFGMEGIEFAALVDIRVALAIGPGADDIRHDRIRIKTTPFILAANTNKAVATIVSRSTGFPVFGGLFNFNNFLYTTSFDLLDQVPTITIPSADSNGDVWAQDEWEIGYIQAPRPGGAVRAMPVFLDLPRNRGLGNIALSQALNPNLGVFEGLKGSAALDAINYGGNIECSAPAAAGGVNYPLGRIMIGKSNPATEFHPSMNKKLHEFLYAQMVQPPMEVDSGWLDVGHIDEILGVVPVPATNSETASRIVVGSPKKAISIISAVTDNNTLIMAGDDFWQMTVGQFKANRRGLLTYNTALQGRIDSIIKQLKTDLGATVIEVPALYDREVSSYPAAWSSNTGTVRLVNYSVTNPANLPTNYTTWYVRFKNGLQFDVLYQAAEAAGGPMTLDGSGNRLVDYISLNGISIPMANWRGVAKKDDVIVFRTVQSAGPASAWLPGMQNAQVANSVVLAPFPYGPVIGGADMIVQAYQKALAGLGLSITYPLNEFFWYHQQLGEVHCSSNKISLPYRNPAQQWWKL